MKYLGFHKTTINWFRSYLSSRRQMVEFEGTLSAEVKMQLGVPQGSILGPILVLIYVNDINKSSQSCSFMKFADNTTVLSTGANIDEAVATMNRELSSIDRWFRRNKLNLNPSKTRYMILNHKTDETKWVKIGDKYLERIWEKGREKSFKLVGIWVDGGLTWDHHITNVAKKINSGIYGLTKASKSMDTYNRKLLYSGLIHSYLVFGLPFWGFAKKGKLNCLRLKQKRAIRKVHGLKNRYHTHSSFVKSRVLKLNDLIEHTTLCYVQSGMHSTSPVHIKKLWTIHESERTGLRDKNALLRIIPSSRQHIHDLPPTARPRYGTPANSRRRSNHRSSKQKTNGENSKNTKRN